MTLDIFFTIFLVLLNGFFVAAEFAIVKVRSSQIEVNSGRSKAVSQMAKSIVNNLDGYLAATQLGITLASLGLGWVGEKVTTTLIIQLFEALHLNLEEAVAHKIAIPLAFLSITILHIVFGELAPKSLAIRKPVPTTFTVAVPLKLFYVVFRPFIWILNGLANVILRAVGIRPVHEHEDIHTEEELRVIIAESHQGGVIEETEKALIQNVFNLGDRQVSALMTPRNEVVWLDITDDPEVNKAKILSQKHTVYPLAKEDLDHTTGFVYSKDLLSENFNEVINNLESISRKLLVVTVHNRAYQLLELFKRERIYQAMVVDEFGSIKGLVTINDIVDALVGDISETNEFEYEVIRNEDGSLLVDGQLPFVEFLELMGLDADPQKVNIANFVTLGGFILDRMGKIPTTGDSISWRNLKLEVIKMDQHRIAKVHICNIQKDKDKEKEEEK
ncbi:hemolysin family protein [Chitinophaga ginsengisoli]|uniref:CBS domain containing-hemolysin-like protein n=1 Tax=Chitinophaga ginsengisoli TaxID=363837 RepID=A0A2P8FGP1_9BACT|nr:hemolysin family protein [Chitinophaga ginsengisoli]PSL20874.1 CBS domain containing-hemolysin-like protein [Chitinophaga ginsengisoli]